MPSTTPTVLAIAARRSIQRTSGEATSQRTALAVSGGYADPIATNWAPADEEQYVVAMPVDPDDYPGTPFTEATSTIYELGANRAYAQAVVAGNEVYIVTDSEDVNSASYGLSGTPTGSLTRLSLTGMDSGFGFMSQTDIPGGASAAGSSLWTCSIGGGSFCV